MCTYELVSWNDNFNFIYLASLTNPRKQKPEHDVVLCNWVKLMLSDYVTSEPTFRRLAFLIALFFRTSSLATENVPTWKKEVMESLVEYPKHTTWRRDGWDQVLNTTLTLLPNKQGKKLKTNPLQKYSTVICLLNLSWYLENSFWFCTTLLFVLSPFYYKNNVSFALLFKNTALSSLCWREFVSNPQFRADIWSCGL